MFEIRFDEKAIDLLNSLPKEIKSRIFDKVISTQANPLHYFERLKGRTDYKLRVGDYRVIADIDQRLKTITVTLVGHRKDVYDDTSH